MEILVCKKCQHPVPSYLYAINYYTSSVIWVNENARSVPCPNCGHDVREGNTKVAPAPAEVR